MNKQIPINLVNGLCPTLMSRAFEKARTCYYLGQGRVWAYPAILVINDNEKQAHLTQATSTSSMTHTKQIAINLISGRKLHAPCQPRRDESEQRNYPPIGSDLHRQRLWLSYLALPQNISEEHLRRIQRTGNNSNLR